MNVIQFNIEVSFKLSWFRRRKKIQPWELRNSIKEYIVSKFQRNVESPDRHLQEVQNAWNTLDGDNLKALFVSTDVIASISPKNVRCFLFHEETEGLTSREKITLKVVLISEVNDIDYSLAVVLQE